MRAVARNSFVSADSKMAVSFDSQLTKGDDLAVSFEN